MSGTPTDLLPDFLFDSTIIIDYLNRIPQAKVALDAQETVRISVITWIEVLAGVPAHAQIPVRDVLAEYTVLPLTAPIADRAAALRRSTRLKLPDAIILATAQIHGLTLVTRNTRDFSAASPDIAIAYTL